MQNTNEGIKDKAVKIHAVDLSYAYDKIRLI